MDTPRPIANESLQSNPKRKVARTILSRSSIEESGPDISLKPFNPDAPTARSRANLPHWNQEGTTYWVTFRLADSLPQEKIKPWKDERDIWIRHHPEPWSDADWREYNDQFGDRIDDWLDAAEGECHLRRPEVRAPVAGCLNRFDGDRYKLGPWVIMPNHVHLLICPTAGRTLPKIMQGIKGVSAKECNSLLGRTGKPFWQQESFDHIVRSQAQYDHLAQYIARNPLKARLKQNEYQLKPEKE